jgi:hypothetical protein
MLSVCASGSAIAFSTIVHRIVDQSMSAKKEERLVRKQIAQAASGFSPGRVRWLTLSRRLTDRVARQLIVEWLVENLHASSCGRLE